jgi:hypothetical protein
MKRLLLLLLLVTPTAHAQSVDSAAVLQPVHDLFDGMRAADTTLMRAAFHPSATLHTTQARPGAAPAVSQTPIAAFLQGIAGAGALLDEQLTSTTLLVDGPLATAWTAYRFYVGDQFSHCGVNTFTLVQEADEWKILHIVDTRRRDACAE